MSKRSFLPALLLLISSVSFTAAQTRPSNAQSAIKLGNRSFAQADYESALREYRSVPPSAGESYAQALYNIGVCYYELWRTSEAIDFYRKAIEARSGRYPRASYALGIALEDQKRMAEAKEAYKQSIVASGDFAMAHYRLGLVTAAEGDYVTAATSFRKALGHSGAHIPASHNNLGVMLARLGRLTDARLEFEIALRETGGNFEDAAYNLKLCRSLLTAPIKTQVAVFRSSEIVEEAGK